MNKAHSQPTEPAQPSTNGSASREQELRAAQPTFMDAVMADARIAAAYRQERSEYRSRLDALAQVVRLMLVTNAFVGLVAYRAKARMQALGIPVLPWLAHRVAIMTAQISIADAAVVQPGVFIPHGAIVVEGMTRIGTGVVIYQWVTIGLMGPGVMGPTIGPGANLGPASQVLGPVKVGKGARIGANSVVIEDVPDQATAVGMPAKVTRR